MKNEKENKVKVSTQLSFLSCLVSLVVLSWASGQIEQTGLAMVYGDMNQYSCVSSINLMVNEDNHTTISFDDVTREPPPQYELPIFPRGIILKDFK